MLQCCLAKSPSQATEQAQTGPVWPPASGPPLPPPSQLQTAGKTVRAGGVEPQTSSESNAAILASEPVSVQVYCGGQCSTLGLTLIN